MRLLDLFGQKDLERIFAALGDSTQLATIVEHVGSESARGAIGEWMNFKNAAKASKTAKLNQFAERLAGGAGRELAEQSALGANSLIIDANNAISLEQVALGNPTGIKSHNLRAAYIKSLPADTDLRIANAVVGEVGSGVVPARGLPIVVSRESAGYRKVLEALANEKIGAETAYLDRGIIADAFFAKTDAGVVPRFLCADRQTVNGLARMAGFDLNKLGGYPALLAKYGTTGFNVTIEGRILTVIPAPL